jgi:ketosteroid isomerase-like protein
MIRTYNNGTVAVRNEFRDETLVDRGGKTTTQETRFTQVLVKAGDRWLVVEQHNSRVPTTPSP